MISKTLLVIIGVAIAVGVGLLIYYLTKKDDKKSDTMTETPTFPPKLGYGNNELYKYEALMDANLEKAKTLRDTLRTKSIEFKSQVEELKVAWDAIVLANPDPVVPIPTNFYLSLFDGTFTTLSVFTSNANFPALFTLFNLKLEEQTQSLNNLRNHIDQSIIVANKFKTKNVRLIAPADANIQNLNKTKSKLLGDCSQDDCSACFIDCSFGDCGVCNSCGCTDMFCCPVTNPPGCGFDGIAGCLGIKALNAGIGEVCSAAAGSVVEFDALFTPMCAAADVTSGGLITPVCAAVLAFVAESGISELCSGGFEQWVSNDWGCSCH